MLVSSSGKALAFQANDKGSNPLTRSDPTPKIQRVCNHLRYESLFGRYNGTGHFSGGSQSHMVLPHF